MTSRRGLIALVLIFGGLTLVLLLQGEGNSRQPAPTSISDFARIFPELTVLDLAAIRVEDPINGDVFTIARDAGGTWIVPGSAAPLYPDAGTGIARITALLPYQRTLPIPEDGNLRQFGFRSQGNFSIQIILANGIQHFVLIGDALQTGPYFYALVDERSEIYIVQRAPIDFLASLLDAPPIDLDQ